MTNPTYWQNVAMEFSNDYWATNMLADCEEQFAVAEDLEECPIQTTLWCGQKYGLIEPHFELSPFRWGKWNSIRAYWTGKGVAIASGSWGQICYEVSTGSVVAYFDDQSDQTDPGYSNIKRFNVEEYKHAMLCDIPIRIDILDIGYWENDGTYEPPCIEHRSGT